MEAETGTRASGESITERIRIAPPDELSTFEANLESINRRLGQHFAARKAAIARIHDPSRSAVQVEQARVGLGRLDDEIKVVQQERQFCESTIAGRQTTS